MDVREAIERARGAIADACARRGRRPEAVRLLAASKTVVPDGIRAAYACGLRLFGENRVQERGAKQAALADLDIEWRLLGPLQSNKARRALELFDAIESLGSLALAGRLSRLAVEMGRAPIAVLLEVNIAGEAQKHGVAPAAALELARAVAELPQLRLRGLMAVPPASADPEASRPHFAALAELSEQIRSALHLPGTNWELSMGMSHDYVVAVEEGATEVRLGQAIFGARG